MDGSVDFRRDWDAYVRGFGDPEGEYWLGLENVHKLTKPRPSFTKLLDAQEYHCGVETTLSDSATLEECALLCAANGGCEVFLSQIPSGGYCILEAGAPCAIIHDNGSYNTYKLADFFADTDLLVALRGRASDGSNMEAPYLDMWIGDGASKYALHVDGFAGGAGVVESMLYHDTAPFSTHDADNDDCGDQCAETFTRGG